MKRNLILVLLCLVCLTSAAFAEDAEYVYYNHDGGEYYHARPDCERIGKGYWNAMTKIAVEDLSREPFAGLKRCAWCFGEIQQPDFPEGKMNWHYESPYDTGSDVEITRAGIYVAGVDLNPGVYTAFGGEGACDLLCLRDEKNQGYATYMMGPGNSCSFYLGKKHSVELPEGCSLRRVQYGPEFQTMDRVQVVSRAFYVMYECPGRTYFVSPMEGSDTSCVWVTRINPEIGHEEMVAEHLYLQPGETVTVDLRQGYDHFLQLRDCVIWPAEEGEG